MSNKFISVAAAGIVLSIPLAFASASPPMATAKADSARDGSADFDSLNGATWHVHNRQLQKQSDGSKAWVEYDASDEFHALPGGVGSEEHYRSDHWKDYVGVGLHLYNRKTATWSSYWVSNHGLPGVLQPPVNGTFSNDVGVFEGADESEGKPVLARSTWKKLGPNHVTWDQAFSSDNGKTWEVNWTMDFTR